MDHITPVILIGGLGSRLRPIVRDRPKGIAEVNGKPFAYYILNQLESHGFKKVVLCTGYMSLEIKEALKLIPFEIKVEYSEEATPLGTAGALRNALSRIDTTHIMLMNGDSYCDLNISKLILKSQEAKAECLMTLIHLKDSQRFGAVQIDDKGFVTQFLSRPKDPSNSLINAGIYIFSKTLIENIPPNKKLSLEEDFLHSWATENKIKAYLHTGRFIDIGTPNSYNKSHSFFQISNL